MWFFVIVFGVIFIIGLLVLLAEPIRTIFVLRDGRSCNNCRRFIMGGKMDDVCPYCHKPLDD